MPLQRLIKNIIAELNLLLFTKNDIQKPSVVSKAITVEAVKVHKGEDESKLAPFYLLDFVNSSFTMAMFLGTIYSELQLLVFNDFFS